MIADGGIGAWGAPHIEPNCTPHLNGRLAAHVLHNNYRATFAVNNMNF